MLRLELTRTPGTSLGRKGIDACIRKLTEKIGQGTDA
jgi:hypothetical protein